MDEPAKQRKRKGKRRRGQPTKLTPAVSRKILQVIEDGNYARVAAAYAGIGETTFYRWLERGESEKSGIYREFREAVKRAETVAEVRCLEKVKLLGAADWKAWMTILERRHPSRWGRRDAVEHSGPGGGPIPIPIAQQAAVIFADPRARALADEWQARVAEIEQGAIEAGEATTGADVPEPPR